eukprot:10087807-Heterocapsa_arctica.AAC.1
MDHREWELNNAHIDLEKQKVLHETLVYDNETLRSREIYQENKFVDLQGRSDERYDLLKEDLR